MNTVLRLHTIEAQMSNASDADQLDLMVAHIAECIPGVSTRKLRKMSLRNVLALFSLVRQVTRDTKGESPLAVKPNDPN
jgi:hypothetical protein